MLGLKLNHVSKRGPCRVQILANNKCVYHSLKPTSYRIIVMPTLSSLVAQEVVMTTTSIATSGDKFYIICDNSQISMICTKNKMGCFHFIITSNNSKGYVFTLIPWFPTQSKELENITSNILILLYSIRCSLIRNKLVDHSDVVGAPPVCAAPTAS